MTSGTSDLNITAKNIGINKIIEEVFNEQMDDDHVQRDLFMSNYKSIRSAVQSGYSASGGYDLVDASMVLQLQNNVAVFSAFKSYRETSEMRVNLYNEDGSKKTWPQFLKESKSIDEKYRVQWLKAEYELAQKQARSADNWMQFERDKDVYPNLEFIASSSVEINPEHVKYYGRIYPLDHPFWDYGLPPIKYGCKCSVRQTRQASNASSGDLPEPIRGVAGNAGKLAMIFTPDHPYIDQIDRSTKQSIKMQLYELKKSFNNDYFTIKGKKGKVDISFNADVEDLKGNFDSAKVLANRMPGKIKILAHNEGQKNPEYSYNGVIGDKTTANSSNLRSYVDNTFKNKLSKDGQLSDQDKCFVLLDFNKKLTSDNVVGTSAKLFGRVKRYESLKFIILQNGDKMIKINRSSFSFNDILSKMQKDLL